MERDMGRLEAFSDGVFAIAITLLVLEIRLPQTVGEGGLLAALLSLWPSYIAYLLSFIVILIMWVNHHNMCRLLARTDNAFSMLNGLLLMFITFLNFPTYVVARHIQTLDQNVAVLLYCVVTFLIAVFFNTMWFYAVRDGRLLRADVDRRLVDAITRSYRFGPLLYVVAGVLALFNAAASLALLFALAGFFAVSSRGAIRSERRV